MNNWSTNEDALKKDIDKYAIWRMEQLINFGLGNDKIKKEDLKKYWSKINIDPARREFLTLILNT